MRNTYMQKRESIKSMTSKEAEEKAFFPKEMKRMVGI